MKYFFVTAGLFLLALILFFYAGEFFDFLLPPQVIAPLGTPKTIGDETPPAPTDEFEGSSVTYKNGGFVPSSITIRRSGGENDCFLKVTNASDNPLLIRLSPHQLGDNWGASYPEIPPGQSSLLDPRYRIDAIAFHNHRSPAEEFSVILETGCDEF